MNEIVVHTQRVIPKQQKIRYKRTKRFESPESVSAINTKKDTAPDRGVCLPPSCIRCLPK